jgi:hypothetical protein
LSLITDGRELKTVMAGNDQTEFYADLQIGSKTIWSDKSTG